MIDAQGTEMMERQRWLEQRSIGLGVSRYYESLARGGEGRSAPGLTLMRKIIPPLAGAIGQWVQDAKDGKAARQAGVALFVGQFEPEDVAFMTARAVINAFGSHLGRSLTSVAYDLANLIEEATASEAFQKADPKAWKRLNTKVERCPYPGKRYILVRKAMDKAQVKRISWGKTEKIRLGVALIEMCAETTQMFDLVAVWNTGLRATKKARTVLRIVPRPDTLSWLDQAHQRGSLQAPVHLPMVVPPQPWKTIRGGGYYDRGLRLRLINAKRINRAYEEELRHRDMPMVYDSINAIQSTPWRINQGVLRVLRDAWDSKSRIGKLPGADPLPLPACPWGVGPMPSMDEPGVKDYIALKGRINEVNEKSESKRLALISKLTVAEEFEQYERIYFPHVLDWRGRVYPVVPYLNPQADDTGRALLEFADGVPLGAEGAYWLAVHGANSYGNDKVTFDERVQWVEEHQDAILDSALNPFNGTRFWADADDPYMFLAFCMEWAGLAMHVGNGGSQDDFVSHLPVSWDGSCNGLQNFSAMLRDPVGGAATNLVPQEYPADIYQRVADVASKQVTVDAANGEVNASYWLGKVTRRVAKRPTMTLPYGSGKYGFRDQLRAELQAYKMEHQENYLKGDEFLCSMYLANVLYDALGQVVVAARHAMDWLKEVSQVAAREGLPIWWTTPSGFAVMQDYREWIGKQVDFHARGRRLQITVMIESDKLDKRKQAQGVSPNFVHSLDAAHLMRTVVLCMHQGIKHFAMVHDSYGTHAGNAAALRDVLRQAFVEQYSSDVLGQLREQLIEQIPEKYRDLLPPVPPVGDLDLTAVMQSEYFFA
jgi:DNA-directed RNA polymerase